MLAEARPFYQRDSILLAEMIEAIEQIQQLTAGPDPATLDRVRRDALLWNFTVLGEAATRGK